MTSVKSKTGFFCGFNDLLLFLDLRCYYRKHLIDTTLQNSHNIRIMNFSNLDFAHLPRQQLTKLVTSFLLKILDSEVNFRCSPHFFQWSCELMIFLINPLVTNSLKSMFHCTLFTCLETEAEILVQTVEMYNFMWHSHGTCIIDRLDLFILERCRKILTSQ